MNALTALCLALLVGASGAFYLRIFRLVYLQAGGKVVATHFSRVDAYLAAGCVTMFIVQCFQSLQGNRGALTAAIDTTVLFMVQLGFWIFVIGTIVLRRPSPMTTSRILTVRSGGRSAGAGAEAESLADAVAARRLAA